MDILRKNSNFMVWDTRKEKESVFNRKQWGSLEDKDFFFFLLGK